MTSTGKRARKRYGNRFAAKRRRDGKAKPKRTRKRFGELPFSVSKGNVPEGAVRANDALVSRMDDERRAGGWDLDSNVSVPGPTREAVDARLYAEEQARKAEERAARKRARQAKEE